MVSSIQHKHLFWCLFLLMSAVAIYPGSAAYASKQTARFARQQSIAPANLPRVQCVYFPQTGHHLSNRAGFLDFWRTNGQVAIFGYPITEEIVEHNQVVQYFEHARFEYRPGRDGAPPSIQLGLLGREELALQPVPEGNNRGGGLYFPETGFSISGEFQRYWERWGGLPIFGFPISEPRAEEGYTVQYFERARMKYQPEAMELFYRQMEAYNGISLNTLYEVVPDDIGLQIANKHNHATAPVAQRSGASTWTPGLWSRRIEVSLSAQWLTAYEDDLVVYRAPVATGKDGFNTPTGQYAVYDKLRIQTMVGSAGGEAWNVPDIPWVMYFVGDVALHGTYWHDRFGTGVRMSHGCVNLGMDDAQWLYQWADLGVPVMVYD